MKALITLLIPDNPGTMHIVKLELSTMPTHINVHLFEEDRLLKVREFSIFIDDDEEEEEGA